MQSPRQTEARRLASLGVPVFPCRVDGKEPATRSGFKDRTTDPAQIEAWWSEADYNLAIVPEDQGLCVVDVDLPELPDWLAAVSTYTVRTPRGGWHLYFRGSAPPSAGTRLGPGIDTRGRGSYVLVPPSRSAGGSYRVSDEAAPLALPATVADKLATPESRPKTAAPADFDTDLALLECERAIDYDLAKHGEVFEGGGSDERTERFAARLLDIYPDEEAVTALLSDRWVPNFDDWWIAVKVGNAMRYRRNAPGCDAPIASHEKFKAATSRLDGGGWEREPDDITLYAKGQSRDVEWLWPGYLPKGALVILAGDPGAGKSTLAFNLMATLSQGAAWPDGAKCEARRSLIWSSEDDWFTTIERRLLAMRADTGLIDGIDCVKGRPFNAAEPEHMASLDKLCTRTKPGLLVIDNIADVIVGDDWKNNVVRQGLHPLVALAERHNMTVLGVAHNKKDSADSRPLDRVMGSRAYGAKARVVLSVDYDEDTETRTFKRTKSNIGPSDGGFEFALVQGPTGTGGLAQRVEWGKALQKAKRPLKGAARLAEFVAEQLQGGPVSSQDLRSACSAWGLSLQHIDRAITINPRIYAYRDGTAHMWKLLSDEAVSGKAPMW